MKNNNKAAAAQLKGRPFSGKPLSYPLAGLSGLSEDATLLLQRAGAAGSQRLDRDVFEAKSRHRYVSPAERESFVPTERMMAAVRELERFGIAQYSEQFQSLYVTRIHDLYTYARGRGSQVITVNLDGVDGVDGRLLAALVGADLESRTTHGRAGGEIVVRARHETATDFEHDASSTAVLTIRNPSTPVFSLYGRIEFTGVLTEARLYPIGTDPLQVSDADTEPGDICDQCKKPHPFAPFQPPLVTTLDLPQFVTVTALPYRGYKVSDIFTAGAQIAPTAEKENA